MAQSGFPPLVRFDFIIVYIYGEIFQKKTPRQMSASDTAAPPAALPPPLDFTIPGYDIVGLALAADGTAASCAAAGAKLCNGFFFPPFQFQHVSVRLDADPDARDSDAGY